MEMWGKFAIPRESECKNRRAGVLRGFAHRTEQILLLRGGNGWNGARATSGWARLKREELQRGFGWVVVDHDSDG
jgi:hypothetical protein